MGRLVQVNHWGRARLLTVAALLFIIVMDWILKQAIDGWGGGLKWLNGNESALGISGLW